MHVGLALALVILTVVLPLTQAPIQASPASQATIRQAYERAERLSSGALTKLVYKGKVVAHWIADGPRFWYRNDVRGEREFILVDAEKGTRGPAFDHGQMAAAVSEATASKADAKHLPFGAIAFVDDGAAVEFVIGATRFRCDLSTYVCAKLEPAEAASPPSKSDEAPTEETPPSADAPSPDGRYVALIRDHNVVLRDVASGEEVRLTDSGDAQHVFGYLSWSPDSAHVVALRTQPGDHLEMYAVESRPADSLRPKLHTTVYELPGDRLDVHELWLIDIAARSAVPVQTDPVDWWGPPVPRWSADGRTFTFEQTDRGFQRNRVIEVNVATATTRTAVDERSDTFLPPMNKMIHYLDSTNEILWASRCSGWDHLYLIDARTGEVRNAVTQGEWVVRGIEKVDERARTVLFKAGGINPKQNPYLVHFCRVNLDGTGLIDLTPANGHHQVEFSPDGRFYIDSYSRVDLAPVTELRRTADGSLVRTLERADVRDLLATGWQWPETYRAKGRDGKTDIWGVIFRPSTLDPARKYPIIESIYAGPQGSSVPATFSAAHGAQAYAELGFIAVQLDGMGMNCRSKAFHDIAYRNLGDSGFPDRIRWMRAAARKYPYMDITRVGVFGHSAGGYNAAHALLVHPEFYKVAIACSANHDHRTDKVWWNELWMGYPVGPHYEEQSNITLARNLQGKLLLVHGELDDNVNVHASTMQFVKALIEADKDFDLIIKPGDGHGYSGTYVQRRMWDYFVRHLRGEEPPEGYQIAVAGGAECTITIRNDLTAPVAVFWVDPDGNYKKYHDLAPGAEVQQHTFYGHDWVAEADGRIVSRFAASAGNLEWDILGE